MGVIEIVAGIIVLKKTEIGGYIVAAGLTLIVKHPFSGEASKPVAMRLAQEHDVLCLPGSMFGSGQEDYLRFAFANVDGELMQPLVGRLIGAQ